MTLQSSIDGAVVELSSLPVGIDGAVVELDSLYAGVDGAKVEIFSAGKKVHNPVNSVTVTGTYSQYASNYGAAVTEDGKVVIYTKFTYNTSYEDVYFVDNGMSGNLVYISHYFGTNGSTGYYYFAVFEGVTGNIDVTLDFSVQNSDYDYVKCNIRSTTATSGKYYKIPDVEFVDVSQSKYVTAYDLAYCEDGNIIVMANQIEYPNTISPNISFSLTLSGLSLIDDNGRSGYLSNGLLFITGVKPLLGVIITGFDGGTISFDFTYSKSSKINYIMTLTAS